MAERFNPFDMGFAYSDRKQIPKNVSFGSPAPVALSGPLKVSMAPNPVDLPAMSLRQQYLAQARNAGGSGISAGSYMMEEMLGIPADRPGAYAPRTASAAGRANIRDSARNWSAPPSVERGTAVKPGVAEYHGPIQERNGKQIFGSGAGYYDKAMREADGAARLANKQYSGNAVVRTMQKAKGMGTLGKVAIGGGLALGALAVADAAMGRDPAADAGSILGAGKRFSRAMKEASRPTYGSSAFQQSTQGLVFGLHNARTAY